MIGAFQYGLAQNFMAKNHCDPAAGCKPKAEVSPANGKPMALVAKWMSVSIRGPAQWRSRKTASSQRGQEFTMYHHQDYILAHSQPRTSRGQRSYKDKRCRQRSRKYETRGVAEERLACIWPGPTAVIARHHHCTGQLPEACCSSSVVSGSEVKRHGNNHQNKFSLKSQGHSNTDGVHEQSVVPKKKNLLWNEHQLIPPTAGSPLQPS